MGARTACSQRARSNHGGRRPPPTENGSVRRARYSTASQALSSCVFSWPLDSYGISRIVVVGLFGSVDVGASVRPRSASRRAPAAPLPTNTINIPTAQSRAATVSEAGSGRALHSHLKPSSFNTQLGRLTLCHAYRFHGREAVKPTAMFLLPIRNCSRWWRELRSTSSAAPTDEPDTSPEMQSRTAAGTVQVVSVDRQAIGDATK